jgi:MoxR-like ATPase
MSERLVTFTPGIAPADLHLSYWLRQVTVRLRREVSWLRYQRQALTASGYDVSPLQAVLDLERFSADKAHFFEEDTTARYLSDVLAEEPPAVRDAARGSLGWVIEALALPPVDTFILALALAAALDNAIGTALAFIQNDTMLTYPTPALAQAIWDTPQDVLRIMNPVHPLFRYGLLLHPAALDWNVRLSAPALVVQALVDPQADLPPGLRLLEEVDEVDDPGGAFRLAGWRVRSSRGGGLHVLPVRGVRQGAHAGVVSQIARAAAQPVAQYVDLPHNLQVASYVQGLAAVAWLKGVDLFIDEDTVRAASGDTIFAHLPPLSIPITLYLGINAREQLPPLDDDHRLPLIDVPALTYEERLRFWHAELGAQADAVAGDLVELARRFRYERRAIRRICAMFDHPDAGMLWAACRAEQEIEMGELAQRVQPRFEASELVLPPKQRAQFDEIVTAMQALTEVHYGWGTARAWNEGGITALFAGPPGTGKTMAAEVLSALLAMPLYRIDLSQVVNKYIGETEKNLKQLFDAADRSDVVLFFDEADAIFGQRTEVKDAHDRYANLEVSYLLERMERFKGLAILATNRKQDVDEAFMRRLRYVIDFPMPDVEQRLAIWWQTLPARVDASDLDMPFLAKQFRLAGGHIRSIVFNACLQNARTSPTPGRLSMAEVITAVKREYDKLNRTVSLEHFQAYAGLVEALEQGDGAAYSR